jgi:hypothetical protein
MSYRPVARVNPSLPLWSHRTEWLMLTLPSLIISYLGNGSGSGGVIHHVMSVKTSLMFLDASVLDGSA